MEESFQIGVGGRPFSPLELFSTKDGSLVLGTSIHESARIPTPFQVSCNSGLFPQMDDRLKLLEGKDHSVDFLRLLGTC